MEASIFTKRLGKSDNMTSWTWVHFSKKPTDKEVIAALRATDGDYNLKDETLVIYHRAIPREQRTINIANCLAYAGIKITGLVHHDKVLPLPGEEKCKEDFGLSALNMRKRK